MHKFFIVAHRGGEGPYQENTLGALKYGLKNGANAVEMDVRYDHWHNVFYLEHDFLHWPWQKHHLLKKIIPALPSTATIFIELKTLYWLRRRYAIYFLKVISKYSLEKKAVIMSFNPFVLAHLRRYTAQLHIGFLLNNRFWGFAFRNWVYWLLKPQFLLLNQRILDRKKFLKKMLNFAKIHKLKILVFTANEPYHWQRIKELNLDGVITDYPQQANIFYKIPNA